MKWNSWSDYHKRFRSVSADEWDYIKSEYEYVENKSRHEMPDRCKAFGDWLKVYKEGCDSKFGNIMVSHEGRMWRHPTFGEFYGGAAID